MNTRKRKLSICEECEEYDNMNMVQCDSCDKWSHFSCVGVGPEIENLDWSCRKCKQHDYPSSDIYVAEKTKPSGRKLKKTVQTENPLELAEQFSRSVVLQTQPPPPTTIVQPSEFVHDLPVGPEVQQPEQLEIEPLELVPEVELNIDQIGLPIKNKNHIINFNRLLKSKTLLSAQAAVYSDYYTENYKEMVRGVSQQILSDEFLKDYSYCGKGGKKELQVYGKVIELIIKSTSIKFPDVPKMTILQYFKTEYVKYAKRRLESSLI